MYPVIDWEQDAAGFWRIRVAVKGETVTFKFDAWPDDVDVQDAAARYAAMTQEQAHAPANSD